MVFGLVVDCVEIAQSIECVLHGGYPAKIGCEVQEVSLVGAVVIGHVERHGLRRRLSKRDEFALHYVAGCRVVDPVGLTVLTEAAESAFERAVAQLVSVSLVVHEGSGPDDSKA
ncbi:unnamed protein product [Ectocarpus sp. 12 AP-2014]